MEVSRNPNNAAVLGNAGSFFDSLRDENAVTLLLKAHSLEPKNPAWLVSLGDYYAVDAHSERENDEQIAADRQNALKAFGFYQRALELTKTIEARISVLGELAPMAYTAEKFEDAQKYGDLLLSMAKQYPKEGKLYAALPIGHTVLGQIELKKGHIAQAKAHLLASANADATTFPELFPKMTLARDLLKANERQVVLEFLKKCRQFDKSPELDDWISEIERGLTPHFEKNIFRRA